MMYEVIWKIDIDADSHRQAAEFALAIMQDPESTAVCFIVAEKGPDCDEVFIDLMDSDDPDEE